MQRVPASTQGVITLPNGKLGYQDANLAAGIEGTDVVAAVMITTQEELAYIVEADGTVELDPNDNTQVLAAIKRLLLINAPSGALDLYLSPAGSDSNSGLTSGAPLLTLVGAEAALQKYNMTALKVTIHLAAGSYAGHNWSGLNTPCEIDIVGAGSTLTTLVGTGGTFGAASANALGANYGALVSISGLKLTATGSGGDYVAQGHGIACGTGSSVTIKSDVQFGACGGDHISCATFGNVAVAGTGLNAGTPYTISGGAQSHIFCATSGVVSAADAVVTLDGTPAFSSAFITASFGSYVGYWGNTFSGSATGVRYTISNNAAVNTNGASSTYLPGSSTGSTGTGGLYV